MKKALSILALLLAAATASAQNDSVPAKPHSFTVSGQHWSRGEIRDGALPDEDDNGVDHAYFLMSSTTLRFHYQYKGLEVKISPRHSGVWGAAGGGSFSLDEGWVALRSRIGFFAQIGRQKLFYDDLRIIGADDWAMAPIKHDVLKTGFEIGRHKLHLLAAFNQNSENTNGGTFYKDGGQPYKSMQTAWYHFDPIPQLGGSLIFMNVGMQHLPSPEENITFYQQLYGAFLDWHPRNLSVQASYYRQSGRDEWGISIRAWMTSLEALWTINPRWQLNSGYFHMSGDEDFFVPMAGSIGLIQKTSVHGFNPIFGSHHKFYGAMDFFYVTTYYGGNTPGLQDFHLGAQWKPIDPLSFKAKYHLLATSVKVEDVSLILGHELELETAWQILPDVSLQAGYTFMKGTSTMERLKRTSDRNNLHWGWLMLVISPEFISVKY